MLNVPVDIDGPIENEDAAVWSEDLEKLSWWNTPEGQELILELPGLPPMHVNGSRDLGFLRAYVFDTLLWPHYRYCWNVAFRRIRDYDGANDAVQNAFIHAYSALRDMTRKRLRTLQVRPWLYKIVLNAALDYLRAQSKQFSVEDPNSWLHRKSNYDNPEQLVLYAEDSEDLERLLAMLPESYRDVVKDVVLRARSYDIVAREYGMKLNAVRTCYHRAIRRLAEVVRQERLTEKDLRRWLEAHLITTSDTGSPHFDMNMPRDFW